MALSPRIRLVKVLWDGRMGSGLRIWRRRSARFARSLALSVTALTMMASNELTIGIGNKAFANWKTRSIQGGRFNPELLFFFSLSFARRR